MASIHRADMKLLPSDNLPSTRDKTEWQEPVQEGYEAAAVYEKAPIDVSVVG